MSTQPTATQTSLAQIDAHAATFSKSRARLAVLVADLENEVAAIRRRHLPAIRAAAHQAGAHCATLRDAVEAAPELFTKPKTFNLHGITVGYRKGSGKVDWADDAKTVALIRKHLPEQAELLIATKETPLADALRQLDARDLARVGVTIEGTGDVVVVKSADSAIDKLVAKLVKEGAEPASGEGEA